MILTQQRREAPVIGGHLCAATVLKSLLAEFSAVTDYRTLRDSLPRRLAHLLKCRCVLLYQRIGEALQFASGTFDETPGWSSSLLAVAHINPISINSDTPEALAWRSHRVITTPRESPRPTFVAVPLVYRQRAIGVLVTIRGEPVIPILQTTYHEDSLCDHWSDNDVLVVEAVAGVAAMLLENTRLLERDRERIHELSLLNSISSQLHCSIPTLDRIRSIVIQRAREISATDLCELVLPSTPPGTIPWIPPTLHEMLLLHMNRRGRDKLGPYASPLVIERPADADAINRGTATAGLVPTSSTAVLSTVLYPHSEYLSQLAGNIKTFFAIPLVSGCVGGRGSEKSETGRRIGIGEAPAAATEIGPKILGVLVGAYHRAWKLRHEELLLLQVLASCEQVGVLVTFSNITSIHRLEEETRRLDRLAALGQMVANVAHEVRNPLASIKSSVQMLLYDLKESPTINRGATEQADAISEETRESVSVVLKEVERLDTIVHDLLLFARPRQLHRVPCKLAELSDQVLQFLQAQCDEAGIAVHRLYQKVPPVRVDVAQMEQVFFNLYMNALQAMPDGGVLTISCQVLPDWLELSVRDTGIGIPPDQLERIFQPFFTTKAHGIGLGLPITRRLIEDHHGQLLVESQFGYGTTITVRLPLVERAMILSNGDELLPMHLPREITGAISGDSTNQVDPWQQWLALRPGGSVSLEEVSERVEQHFIRWALETAKHNRTRAAELLGLAKVDQLRYLMRKHGIE